MKNKIIILSILVFTNLLNAKPKPEAEENKNKQTQTEATATPLAIEIPITSILSPTFLIGDILFISEALKSVEIKTNETEAYLNVDEKLHLIIDNPQVKARPIEEAVLIDIDYLTLKNIVFLMERAKFSAGNAIRYKRFITAIKDAENTFVAKSKTK